MVVVEVFEVKKGKESERLKWPACLLLAASECMHADHARNQSPVGKGKKGKPHWVVDDDTGVRGSLGGWMGQRIGGCTL